MAHTLCVQSHSWGRQRHDGGACAWSLEPSPECSTIQTLASTADWMSPHYTNAWWTDVGADYSTNVSHHHWCLHSQSHSSCHLERSATWRHHVTITLCPQETAENNTFLPFFWCLTNTHYTVDLLLAPTWRNIVMSVSVCLRAYLPNHMHDL